MHMRENFTTTDDKLEKLVYRLLTFEKINATNCLRDSKRSAIPMIVTATEKNEEVLNNYISELEKIFHEKIWVNFSKS